jgi:hypothetical protein
MNSSFRSAAERCRKAGLFFSSFFQKGSPSHSILVRIQMGRCAAPSESRPRALPHGTRRPIVHLQRRTAMETIPVESALSLVFAKRRFDKASKASWKFIGTGTVLLAVLALASSGVPSGPPKWQQIVFSPGLPPAVLVVWGTISFSFELLRYRRHERKAKKGFSRACECIPSLEVHEEVFHGNSAHVQICCPQCQRTLFSKRIWSRDMNPDFKDREPTLRS